MIFIFGQVPTNEYIWWPLWGSKICDGVSILRLSLRLTFSESCFQEWLSLRLELSEVLSKVGHSCHTRLHIDSCYKLYLKIYLNSTLNPGPDTCYNPYSKKRSESNTKPWTWCLLQHISKNKSESNTEPWTWRLLQPIFKNKSEYNAEPWTWYLNPGPDACYNLPGDPQKSTPFLDLNILNP